MLDTMTKSQRKKVKSIPSVILIAAPAAAESFEASTDWLAEITPLMPTKKKKGVEKMANHLQESQSLPLLRISQSFSQR